MKKKLHPHKMPPSGGDVKIEKVEFVYKLPSAEHLVGILIRHTGRIPKQVDAAKKFRDDVLEVAASVADRGEHIATAALIRKLKEKP